MINSVSHDSVSCLVADRPMCFATALDKAFENIDCMSAILRCQAKNHIYESTQRLIQPRRVLWAAAEAKGLKLQVLKISDGNSIDAAFEDAVKQGAQAV